MRVLIVCEESQAICKAFRKLGYEAYSNDLKECSGGYPEWHLQMDAFEAVNKINPLLLIGHPPCTYISYAGTQSWNDKGRVYKRLEALKFFADLWELDIPHICLENPKSCASPVIAKYTQEIQPYYFGESFYKTTWLWLKNLPKLTYSLTGNLFEEQTATDKPQPISIDNTERGKKRHFTECARGSEMRSKTFCGIANAMAEQWSEYIMNLQNSKSA